MGGEVQMVFGVRGVAGPMGMKQDVTAVGCQRDCRWGEGGLGGLSDYSVVSMLRGGRKCLSRI